MENNNNNMDVQLKLNDTNIYSNWFKCIICSNSQDIPSLFNAFTPICNECLKDLKYFVETRRTKP